MEQIRMEALDEQCFSCGYDIEMQDFIIINDKCEDKIFCLECYNHFFIQEINQ